MKILLVITGLFPGGAEKIVMELARNLLLKGLSVSIVSLLNSPAGPECTVVDKLNALKVPLFFLDLRKHPLNLFRLIGIIRREKPDVIHSHLMHANIAARFANLFCRFPLINTIHIAERRNTFSIKLLFLLDKLTYRLCNAYTAVSKAAAKFHEQRCSLPENTIQVILNGSDPVKKENTTEIQHLREIWGLNHVNKIIGSIGRSDYQKGYDIFLQTLPDLQRLVPQGERWGILFIGDGPELKKLRNTAKEIAPEIPDLQIFFAGYYPDAAKLMPIFDLFVMPSRYEGFGLTLTEALSAGVPCLCSNADSLPELCAFSPDTTMTCDFIPGRMHDIYIKALSLPHSAGVVLRTTEEMTGEYYKIYVSFSNSKFKNENL